MDSTSRPLVAAASIALSTRAPRPPVNTYDVLVQGGLQSYAVAALKEAVEESGRGEDIAVEISAVGTPRETNGEFGSLAEIEAEAELHAGDVICGTVLGKAAVGLVRVTATGEPIPESIAHHPGRPLDDDMSPSMSSDSTLLLGLQNRHFGAPLRRHRFIRLLTLPCINCPPGGRRLTVFASRWLLALTPSK